MTAFSTLSCWRRPLRAAARPSWWIGRLSGLALLLPAAVSNAADADPVTADALFERGRALMAEGRTADACATFAESNRIDPATGTLLNLASCNEALGKTATAWTQFRAAEVAARNDGRTDRVDFARAHQEALEARLSYLTLQVRVTERRDALLVLLDDQPIEAARWNVPIPIDPGAHTVSAELSGGAVRAFAVSVPQEAATLSVVVDVDASNGALLAGSETSGSGTAALDAPSQPLRTLAYVSGGIGAAALGASIVFGARAFSEWDERNRRCPMDACITPAGQRSQRSAENAARNANIAFGTGLLALASGVGLYLLSAESAVSWAWVPRLIPTLGAREVGLAAEARW